MKTINNISEFISTSKSVKRAIQTDLLDVTKSIEFLEFCKPLSEKILIDEMKGIRRVKSPKTYDEVLPLFVEPIKTGIKIHHQPIFKIDDHENWEGGFIELMSTTGKLGNDYFIWMYIRMNHLETILNEYSDSLIDYNYK